MSIALSKLISETRIYLSDAQCGQSPLWDDTDLTLYINNALLTLWGLLPSDALRSYEDVDEQNLAVGTAEYDLPADYYIEMVVMYSGIPCRKVKYSEKTIWNNNVFLKPRTSQPAYYIHGSKVGLVPTPSTAVSKGLEFFYLKIPPTLTTGTSVIIDASYSPIISQLAAGKAALLKTSIAEGKSLIEAALNDLKILIGKDEEEESDESDK